MSSRDFEPFELFNLPEERLNYILALPDEQKTGFFHSIITRYFNDEDLTSEKYKELQLAYKASFMLEKVYRNNKALKEGFRPIYTKTGLIRDLVNDLYFTDDNLITH